MNNKCLKWLEKLEIFTKEQNISYADCEGDVFEMLQSIQKQLEQPTVTVSRKELYEISRKYTETFDGLVGIITELGIRIG